MLPLCQVLLADVDFGREPLEWSSVERLGELSFNEDLDTRPWWTPSPDESLLDAGPTSSEAARQPWHERDTQVRGRIRRGVGPELILVYNGSAMTVGH